MAGFADEISHFNPYISQIPSDEYVNAGMLEQGRYEAGVARTQQMIDNVAGLQVAGDANTQYLRQKVSQIEGKVSQVVGSDFAKNSVSNQIGGLIGQVYRDPVVQAGMTSAVRLQNYQKSWDDLRKDHPDQYSDKNKEYFDQYVNDYLKQSQTKAGLTYNGPQEATPYVDYYGKMDKELKSLDPSIQTSISPAGEFMYRIDKSSTVSKDQIDGVLNSVITSDPRIQQQMQIDAWHAYRSFDGSQMFDHINQSFNSMIDNYKNNSDYYRGLIKANPNDHETITAAQKKLVDFNTEMQNLATNRDTYLKAINNGQLDQVKQSVFNDSVRQGLILKYERNNITTDLKNNENAIESWKNHFEEEHLGIERERNNIEKLSYELKLAEWQAKNQPGFQQKVQVPGPVGQDYTEDQNNAVITNLQSGINDSLTKLRSYHSNMNDAQWKQYQDTQEAKYQAGDASVDPKYAQYKSLTQQQRILLDTYTGIGNKIYSDADSQFQIQSMLPQWSKLSGVDFGNGDRHDVTVDKDTMTKALALRERILSHQHVTTNIVPGSSGGFSTQTTDVTPEEIAEEERRYAADPNFRYIKALAEGALHGHDVLQPTASDLTTYMQQKANFVSDQFKKFGETSSYEALPLAGKPEQIAYYNRVVSTALQNGQGKAQGGKDVAFENIESQNIYNDDMGRLNIQYMDKKDSKMYTITVPAKENKLGNPDPYLQIARAIDISPNKSTPVDATKALSTMNGKIKYVLQRDPLSGNYEMRIWNKGALYNVPSDPNFGGYTAPTLGPFIERVEYLSKLPQDQIDKLLATLSTNQ